MNVVRSARLRCKHSILDKSLGISVSWSTIQSNGPPTFDVGLHLVRVRSHARSTGAPNISLLVRIAATLDLIHMCPFVYLVCDFGLLCYPPVYVLFLLILGG